MIGWLALDIGGANIKVADGLGFAATTAFSLWREPTRLTDALRAVLAGSPPADHLAVTMTGELADCFATKAEGVQKILDAGATIIGGSDWDVSTYNPFRAFQVAVTRAGGPGQKPLNIDERIPLETAIDAYTINAAYAMKHDKITGSLEVGKRADLVVLDRDILTTAPETIQETKVLATYLDGRLVYSAQPGSNAEDAKDDEEDEEPGRWWDEREARTRQWLRRD